jgi:hypothetical protein
MTLLKAVNKKLAGEEAELFSLISKLIKSKIVISIVVASSYKNVL